MRRWHLVAVGAALLVACNDNPTGQGSRRALRPPVAPAGGSTHFHARMAQIIAEREARGEPTPTLSYQFKSEQGASLAEVLGRKYAPGTGYSYTATTLVEYRGPADAGLERWPHIELTPEQSAKLGITGDELEQRYVAQMAERHPGFWDRYALGYEPRTYEAVESRTVTYPERPAAAPVAAMEAIADATATAAADEELVFGFSVDMPVFDERGSFGFRGLVELEFTFEMDFDIGFRFPVFGHLENPAPMAEGSMYAASTLMEGRNWSGSQYRGVGLPSEGGDEAYVSYLIKGCVELSGGGVGTGKQCATYHPDQRKDYTTPLGAGVTVRMPDIDMGVVDYGVVGLDFEVRSSMGSDRITGDWRVTGAAIGSGRVTYQSPDPVSLPAVRAVDGPGRALYSIDGLLYHFTRFTVSPDIRVWVDVSLPNPFGGDPTWKDSWPINLGTYELSDIIDHDFLGSDGASVGVHRVPGYTGGTRLGLTVDVVNVAPTASIAVKGGRSLGISGAQTIVGATGETFTFKGVSHDPGRDDLTLSWSWGDGPPAPDVSTSYPLAAAVGPNNATDIRTHVFDRACLYDVTLTSIDDDDATAEDHAFIVVTEAGNAARMEGYWQHQLARVGASLLPSATIDCYLAIVGRMSTIFGEVRSVSSAAAAHAVMNLRHNAGSEVEQLDRELLVAWLNFASGAIDFAQQVDTDGDGAPDTPLGQALHGAERVRVDPASTASALRRQTQLVHAISTRFTGSGSN